LPAAHRQLIGGLAAVGALCLAGCGGVTLRTRATTTAAASGKPSDPSAVAAPRLTSTVPPAGVPGARPIGASAGLAQALAQDRVSLWLPYWTMTSALQSALANSGPVGTAFPFWYAILAPAIGR
jgi:hypothetical protein